MEEEARETKGKREGSNVPMRAPKRMRSWRSQVSYLGVRSGGTRGSRCSRGNNRLGFRMCSIKELEEIIPKKGSLKLELPSEGVGRVECKDVGEVDNNEGLLNIVVDGGGSHRRRDGSVGKLEKEVRN